MVPLGAGETLKSWPFGEELLAVEAGQVTAAPSSDPTDQRDDQGKSAHLSIMQRGAISPVVGKTIEPVPTAHGRQPEEVGADFDPQASVLVLGQGLDPRIRQQRGAGQEAREVGAHGNVEIAREEES